MSRRTVWATGCGIALIIAIFLFYALVAPSSDQLRSEAIDQARAITSVALDKQIVEDLNAWDESVSVTHQGFDTADVSASLTAKSGVFYDFDVSGDQGGGFEVIARLNPDGHFTILWQGQDYVPCGSYNEYIQADVDIPPGIEPYCAETVIVDRSNLIRTAYTSFF